MASADHVSMTDQPAISTLTLQHRIPDDWTADPWAEVRPLIDGVDVLEGSPPGRGGAQLPTLDRSCRELAADGPEGTAQNHNHRADLHRWLLRRPVRHHAPRGRPGDLGRLGKHQRHPCRARGHPLRCCPVRNRTRTGRSGPQLGRAGRHRSRLLEQTLTGSGWFEQWGCVLTGVWPRRTEPDVPEELISPEGVDVEFHHVQEPGKRVCSYAYELFSPTTSPRRNRHGSSRPAFWRTIRGRLLLQTLSQVQERTTGTELTWRVRRVPRSGAGWRRGRGRRP
ncbi:hypothetical protein SALBM135S_03675 [Streptomyces alboniger]